MLGLTVAEMAKLAGIGFTTMVRLESADGVPAGNVKTLTAVKSAMKKPVSNFLVTQKRVLAFAGKLKSFHYVSNTQVQA